jgi:hypothetical protein
MRFMAMARVSCVSFEMEPKDMAPVEKRLTISFAGSTSSRGMGSRRISSSPRRVKRFSLCSLK